jgi:hypothetical protein
MAEDNVMQERGGLDFEMRMRFSSERDFLMF